MDLTCLFFWIIYMSAKQSIILTHLHRKSKELIVAQATGTSHAKRIRSFISSASIQECVLGMCTHSSPCKLYGIVSLLGMKAMNQNTLIPECRSGNTPIFHLTCKYTPISTKSLNCNSEHINYFQRAKTIIFAYNYLK